MAYLKEKIESGREILEREGILLLLKKLVNLFFRPFEKLIKKNKILLEFFYGFLPKAKEKIFSFKKGPEFIRLPKTDLLKRARHFWYSAREEEFDLGGEKIKRKDVFVYGGPNPKFSCPVCQRIEWLSRIRQKNLFLRHNCPEEEECEKLCQKQGNELWVHFHQNFDFAIGIDPQTPAPKLLYITCDPNDYYLSVDCNCHRLVRKRRMAFAAQFDVLEKPHQKINWKNYDLLYISLTGLKRKFKRPSLPIIAEGHDYWEDKELLEWILGWLEPDILLAPDPVRWQEYIKIPKNTKVLLYPLFDSEFFSRPNLERKKFDLLAIGATSSAFYEPRLLLDKQIRKISSEYKIEFSHNLGIKSVGWEGETLRREKGREIRFLNKWSEYIGLARYVIFGRVKHPGLNCKYYESLGSGAIPIFPQEPDLEYLKLNPYEHYIPLSEVEGRNDKLRYFLDHYQDYKYIAQNAVRWHKENSDKLLFNDFKKTIKGITNFKYPEKD